MTEQASASSAAVPIFVAAFAVASAVMAVMSGGFLEADGITHYLYARAAVDHPWVLTDVWGRPIVKLLHVLPASVPGEVLGQPIALILVRWTSLMIAIAGALLAGRVATRLAALQRVPWAAVVFALGSPLVFLHTFAVLTELPFGLLMLACLASYQRKCWWLLAVLGGLLPAARPEGIGFVLMIAGGLVLHRRWLELPLLAVGTLTWATAGWLIANAGGTWPIAALQWLTQQFPYSGESAYQPGPLMKFVGMLPAATGPTLLPLVLFGSISFAAKWRAWRSDHDSRVGLVILAVPAIVLVVHSLLHWTGKMASSGDVRYLVAVWPFWGLLAARGFGAVLERRPMRHARWVAVGLVVLPTLMLQAAYPIVPLREDQDAADARAVAAWVESPDGLAAAGGLPERPCRPPGLPHRRQHRALQRRVAADGDGGTGRDALSLA